MPHLAHRPHLLGPRWPPSPMPCQPTKVQTRATTLRCTDAGPACACCHSAAMRCWQRVRQCGLVPPSPTASAHLSWIESGLALVLVQVSMALACRAVMAAAAVVPLRLRRRHPRPLLALSPRIHSTSGCASTMTTVMMTPTMKMTMTTTRAPTVANLRQAKTTRLASQWQDLHPHLLRLAVSAAA